MINLNYNIIGAGEYDRYANEEAQGFIPFQIQYVIVPGGGGAAGGNNQIVSPKVGIAGNAGIVLSGSYCVQPLTDYPIVIGLGGAGGTKGISAFEGQNGGTSSFNADIIAFGGLGGVSQTYLTGSTFAGNGSGASASADLGGNGNQWTYNLPGPFPNPLIPGQHGGQYISESYYGGGGAGLNVSGSPVAIEFALIGGGGGGASAINNPPNLGDYGAGGGGGGVYSGSFILEPQVKTFPIVIGAGGLAGNNANASNGVSSSAFNIYVQGGFGGASRGPGGNAGTGSLYSEAGDGATGLAPGGGGQTSNGSVGTYGPTQGERSGGAGGNGLTTVFGAYGAGGGGGYALGNGISYIGATGTQSEWQGVYPGRGGTAGTIYASPVNGQSGSLILRYPGTGSKATGGTITYDAENNYTYHTFTASANLVLDTYEPTVASGLPGLGGGGYANGTGSANTGGGAGASFYNFNGANGGSGFVAIRYEGAPIAEGGEIITTDNYTYHTFTASAIFKAIGQESNNNINPCPGINTIAWNYEAKTQADGLSLPNTLVAGTSSINTSGVAINVAVSQSANGQFTSDLIIPVTASLSGSGTWPTTGSNVMQIEITNEYYFNKSAGINMSAAQGNMNLSGSIISVDFLAGEGVYYYVSSSIVHTKGNIYNPAINWRTENNSPISVTTPINGYTASFNVVKNINEPLVSVPTVTGSKSATFQNDYAFNITSSLTASINNVTGSTTMSILIPEAGISYTKIFSNPTTTTALLTASFAASTNSPYNVTASVVMNKGNIATSSIDWKVSGSLADGVQSTGSLKIVKDAIVNMVNVNDVFQSTGSSFNNDYAFNITASFSGSFTSSWVGATSASIGTSNFIWKSDKLGFNINTISSSINFSTQFEAQSNVLSYDITASISESIASASLIQTFGKRSGTHFEADVFAIEGLVNSGSGIFTSSYETPGNFSKINLLVSGGIDVGNGNINVTNFDTNFFPFPYNPQFNVSTFDNDYNTLVAYWGKPSMELTGDTATTYISSSNITLHGISTNGTFEFSSSVVPTTGSHILAETMTVGGGGRGGTKDAWFGLVPSGRAFIFSGGGGAGGYILANNYFQKGVAYNIVVGAGAPRWDGTPAGAISPTSGSDTYIVGNGATIQLSKGGGNGGPVTGSGWDGPDINTQGAGGRAGGSAGGGGYVDGQARTELGANSITGSVSNPFETYGAFDGFGGGTAYSPFRLPSNIPNAQTVAGGGGGASQDGFDNLATTNTLGAGGLGKYDLSFTMGGVAGGGAGANYAANGTGSLSFGGGNAQRYTVSGSLIDCDGVDGTGGGGGGLISGSLQPGQAPFNYTTKGGSGKVQIRYVSNVPLASGGTIESGSISGSNYILHTFTGSGTFTPNL